MTHKEARAYLKSLDYEHGRDTTAGMTGEKRAKVKAALRVLRTLEPAPAPAPKAKA